MNEEHKNILGGAALLTLIGIGLKRLSRSRLFSSGQEGFAIVTAKKKDFPVVYSLFKEIILRGRNPEGPEKAHIEDAIHSAIDSGDCAIMLDRFNRKIGFVCGGIGNLTEQEMYYARCTPTNLFQNYQGKVGFKGFGLGVISKYRGLGLGLDLMGWLRDRTIFHNADYVWLGANSDLNNREMWATRTDIVGEGPHITFFAHMV